jgi:hypothetical protein
MPKPAPAVPSADLWITPLVWGGSPLRALSMYREIPNGAVFTRATLIYTLSKEIGPGMTQQSEAELPGLIRLENAKPVEVHTVGFDGKCWTYRAEKRGRKTFWPLYTGDAFPATAPVSEDLLREYRFDRIIIQSVLTQASNRKAICFMLRDDFSMENLANARDEDPDD